MHIRSDRTARIAEKNILYGLSRNCRRNKAKAIEREIRKRISRLKYLFLDFHFYHSIGKSEKGFEKLSLRTAVFHAHAYLAKRRPLFTRIVLRILFRISESNGKKEIHEIRISVS